MYPCLHERLVQHTGDIRLSRQQSVEHNGLHREYERYHIRGVNLLQIDGQCVVPVAGNESVGAEVLSSALEREMLDGDHRVRSAVTHIALSQTVHGILEQQCSRPEMDVDQRPVAKSVETGNTLYVPSVIACTLCSQERPLLFTEREVVAQRMLQLSRCHFTPSFGQRLVEHRLLAEREMRQERVVESECGEDRLHLHSFRGNG